ncbi:OLC1v1025745C1 [Oldenlandia corymbosa var. corymbosa]|uniref:OLC1v1025745C1 n=1 Tax=Oldenlandia corymbosa var. corymbosa TaxID=529605 RepID=A0AAV1C5M2_OLDCO|nr:OLC1v1025745C1 [Oldenlandia corymbosa var. corymbosa]
MLPFFTGKKVGVKPGINLEGYMIGNGVCDDYYDGANALIPFAHGKALIPDSLYKLTSGLNIYNILEPCYHGNGNSVGAKNMTGLPASFRELGKTNKPLPVRNRMFGRAWPYRAPVRDGLVPTWAQLTDSLKRHGNFVPCINDEVATRYLNDKDVRNALRVSPEKEVWSICQNFFPYYHDAGSMLPYHKNLTAKGYRALIYSGDHDMCVPFTGSEAWTASLGLEIVDKWRSWKSDSQIAGYLQAYAKNLTFLTIKGAGHTVPEYKPRESLDFYTRWLEGQRI